jgi:hypothetical protein
MLFCRYYINVLIINNIKTNSGFTSARRQYEQKQNLPSNERWIRKIHISDNNPAKFFIICFTNSMAYSLFAQMAIKMDMSFKMVHNKMNIFALAGLNTQIRRKLNLGLTFV